MADGCFYTEESDAIQKIFTQNFLEHYTKSKAPFPLFFHAAWFFNRPHRKDGFFKFIDSILALPDVYFVTSQELIAWTRYPEPLPNVMTTNPNIIRLSNKHNVTSRTTALSTNYRLIKIAFGCLMQSAKVQVLPKVFIKNDSTQLWLLTF